MKKKSLTALAIVIFVCGLSLIATAQWKDNMGGSWNNPTSASIGNIINDRLWNRVFAKARARDKARGSTPTKPTGSAPPAEAPGTSQKTPAQIDAVVRFRSTGTQLEVQSIANELSAGGTPETKKQIPLILSALLTEYEKAAKEQGKPNDLALATTAALVYNSSIYNGTPEPDDARIMEIRDALAELMVEDDTLASMSDRQKQVLYEKLVISTMLAKAGYEEAKASEDKSTMATYREAAGQTLRAVSGMSPEKVDFSNEAARRNAERLLNADPAASRQSAPASPVLGAEYMDGDPFPDKPWFQPQQPLIGRLRKTITMADLTGNWTSGGGSIMEYVTSSTQSQTSVSVTREDFTIRANGTYESKSQSRLSNTTVRESERGTITLSGNFVIKKSSNGREMRYQFVAFMEQPNGSALLTLLLNSEGPPMDGDALRAQCGHAHGYVTCMNAEQWVRKP